MAKEANPPQPTALQAVKVELAARLASNHISFHPVFFTNLAPLLRRFQYKPWRNSVAPQRNGPVVSYCVAESLCCCLVSVSYTIGLNLRQFAIIRPTAMAAQLGLAVSGVSNRCASRGGVRVSGGG